MQQIINFIIRNKNFLLSLLLFSISMVFTIQTHSYHKSRFINSANFLTGGIYNSINNFTGYLSLKSQNQVLAEENSRLKMLLFNSESKKDSTYLDTVSYNGTYKFTLANVIRNTYSGTNNVLLLNRGKNDGLKQDLGVISSKGIVGIIDGTSKHYATVISVLNTINKISAQLKKTNHFGTLYWDAKSPNFIQLTDIPKIAPIVKGDTIITSGRSSIFPKGIPIGIINDFKLDAAENYYEINIKLFNDMTNLEHVYTIENIDTAEIDSLLNKNTDE
ncbi:rod shape-determining protein MreC [Mariniflexile fucanivorans]|uniref:Cell shape-determining protein MreC n=1 Tax=Mariniflexile fucanivorans TaxID=264023 RepID=A0A4R1RHC6_9FLAO|nr:rod shape-determining protein MreC [Mariniflexile fucanivorans]TCL65444.1 rod shape-determining protein MreC [Mariniflexile fucanivorans]